MHEKQKYIGSLWCTQNTAVKCYQKDIAKKKKVKFYIKICLNSFIVVLVLFSLVLR